AEVVQQARRWGAELQGPLERLKGLRVSPGRAQHGAEILPVAGDCWLHLRERIENSNGVLGPPLSKQDFPEHLERAWMMVVCAKHLQALRLRGSKLVACQILP